MPLYLASLGILAPFKTASSPTLWPLVAERVYKQKLGWGRNNKWKKEEWRTYSRQGESKSEEDGPRKQSGETRVRLLSWMSVASTDWPSVQSDWTGMIFFLMFFFSFIFISWRLITSQHCSGFCHTSTWISHGVTCIPHPNPPSHLPLHPISLGLPSAPGPSTCLMHPTWAGDLFHPR